uniref:Uncharacterized protein n=1 Tax=Haptolina brevifila TaxID=156173 RepID=A0A7S2FR81_9EUKA
MDQISGCLQTMHAQAMAMNSELKTRETQLDKLVDTAVNQNSEIKKHIKDTASVGGREAKRIARGGQDKSGSEETLSVLGEVVAGERSLGSASMKVAAVSSRMAAFKAMSGT